MCLKTSLLIISAFSTALLPLPVQALNLVVPAFRGDISRNLLGDGTGVIVGVVDSGIDDLHPALTGIDSLGNPRMVAEANFVTSEPENNGDDYYGHGTWVASAVLSADELYTGVAPDARYVNARVIDDAGRFISDIQVRNGIGFAISQGADILNISLTYDDTNSGGTRQLDLMLDWAAFDRGISCAICAGNISSVSGSELVRGPGGAYNGLTVGQTGAGHFQVNTDSTTAFTADGRMKPDVVAPGTALTLANDDWEGSFDWDFNLDGCSFATGLVSGLMAQQLESGRARGLSTNPLVVKATLMNSASKVLDKQGNPWQPNTSGSSAGIYTVAQPLDSHSGAGGIDGLALAAQYLAGQHAPGLVADVGWDLNTVSANRFVDYVIDSPLAIGSTFSATLSWNRHINRVDDGNGIIDALDNYTLAKPVSNLDLHILRDGNLLARSSSFRDNVEHLVFPIEFGGEYTLRVWGRSVTGGDEPFALAWHTTAVPEPPGLFLACASAAGLVWLGGRPRYCKFLLHLSKS